MFCSIEEAIEEVKSGGFLVVVDDEDRENEGDLIVSGDKITPDAITFMMNHGKGLICAPISKAKAKQLKLGLMVEKLEDTHGTAFTVSVDAAEGISTGISSFDRAKTIEVMARASSRSAQLISPGHMFPLIAKDGGVVERPGHTEAAIDLMRLAGHSECAVICEILKENGECARLDDLKLFCEIHQLKLITIESLVDYQKKRMHQ